MYASLRTFPGDLFAEFEAVQRQLQRVLGLGDFPTSIRAAAHGAFPAINMGSTDEAVEVYAFAPGIDPAKIDISLDKGVLTISGERASDIDRQSSAGGVYANERFTGSFRRAISLPDYVDTARVEASYRNGILKIVLPKREGMKPRRIEIKELEYKA